MNIRFEANNQEYQLTGGTGDFLLSRCYGIQENKKGEPVERTKYVGAFGDVFRALEYVIKDQALNNDATSLLELKEIYLKTISDIREIAELYRRL